VSDPQPPESVIHEYRPSCARQECSAPPAPGRPFCAAHERELEAGVKPGLSEDQWVGGVDPAVAKTKADALERQWIEAEQAKNAEAHTGPITEQTELGSLRVGPDPDTSYPPATLRAVKQALDAEPTGLGTAELLCYLRGEHGVTKKAMAEIIVDTMVSLLKRL
jgi:hypothetical protein